AYVRAGSRRLPVRRAGELGTQPEAGVRQMRTPPIDARLRGVADAVDAHRISRREFVRKAAIVTGSAAAGLHTLRSMASAQAKPKMRAWLFKSCVTDCNDVLAKHVEHRAAERKVDSESHWPESGA